MGGSGRSASEGNARRVWPAKQIPATERSGSKHSCEKIGNGSDMSIISSHIYERQPGLKGNSTWDLSYLTRSSFVERRRGNEEAT